MVARCDGGEKEKRTGKWGEKKAVLWMKELRC
jgi:hypothetical protein